MTRVCSHRRKWQLHLSQIPLDKFNFLMTFNRDSTLPHLLLKRIIIIISIHLNMCFHYIKYFECLQGSTIWQHALNIPYKIMRQFQRVKISNTKEIDGRLVTLIVRHKLQLKLLSINIPHQPLSQIQPWTKYHTCTYP